MTDMAVEGPQDAAPAKKSSKGLLISVALAAILGGVSFAGVFLGMIPLPFGGAPPSEEAVASKEDHGGDHESAHLDDIGAGVDLHDTDYRSPPVTEAAFLAVQPLIVSLGPEAKSTHLKVSVQIEVAPNSQESVAAAMPRIVDVLNTYLRAVDERDIEVPRAMLRLKAQMLRRVQLVTPPEAVRDILIQEFILN